MAFQNLTMNLTALESINPPNVSVSNSYGMTDLATSAGNATSDFLIFGTMIIILIVLYLALSDKTPFQEFGYDDLRALNIALSCATLIGLTMVSVEWSDNFYAIGMFGTSWFLTFIGIQSYENKE